MSGCTTSTAKRVRKQRVKDKKYRPQTKPTGADKNSGRKGRGGK
jgi:hypothetical protein